jgi:hypothetical protein
VEKNRADSDGDGVGDALTDSEVEENRAIHGGGIFNVPSGSVTLTDSEVEENRAFDGGGICNSPGGTVTLTDSEVEENRPNNCAPLNSVLGCTG